MADTIRLVSLQGRALITQYRAVTARAESQQQQYRVARSWQAAAALQRASSCSMLLHDRVEQMPNINTAAKRACKATAAGAAAARQIAFTCTHVVSGEMRHHNTIQLQIAVRTTTTEYVG